MIRRRQLSWQKLILFLTVLPCCWSLHVFIPNKVYKANKGQEVTLICSFTPSVPVVNNLVLTWDAYPDVTGDPLKPVATYYLNNPVEISPSYKDRADLEVDISKGISTLSFKEVTMQDSRHYQCNVKIPGEEGITAASTSLLVLEPPSPPLCTLQGRAEYFNDITLTCKSDEGSPPPDYQWTTYSIENIPREFPPKTTQKNGVLSLFNISRDSSGFFICISSNEIASASCNFTLAVMPGSMNFGSTAGIIGGVVAGLLVLGIIIFCCCRKKGKKDKNAEDSPGDMVFYDKDGPEAGEQYWDDKSNIENKQVDQFKDKDVPPEIKYIIPGGGQKLEDDQNNISGKERHDEKGSDIDSHRYQEDQHDRYRGSRDQLDEQRDRYGSRDRLEDRRDNYGSRDRLDDRRDNYGSRDRLDDRRDPYGGRDRLEDRRDPYGSRDRLEDRRDHYGSQDRLDDRHDRYEGRDRVHDQRDRYGSRDRLDDRHDRYGSQDRLDDRRERIGGSRDHLDYIDSQHRN